MSAQILIIHPPGYETERKYLFDVIFSEFFGLSYQLQQCSGNTVAIRLLGDQEKRTLVWRDVLFQTKSADWLSAASLPKTPLPKWRVRKDIPEANITNAVIPIIYGRLLEGENKDAWFVQNTNSIRLGLDIAGSIFFMLTRYEEIALPDRDEHGRFPAKASLAYREGFLERPIVDEYVEILWTCMKRLWPGLERKEQRFQLCLSHDVDHPLATVNKPWPQVLRGIGGDVLKRKDLYLAWRRFKTRATKNYTTDPYNTFDWIMDLSERHGLKSAFYFKAGSTNPKYDEHYSLSSPWIRQLIKRIHERGHEIGFHPSYETCNNPSLFRAEFETFIKVMDELKISQDVWGGREHYLRWENPITWQIWDEAGLDYDATLGFADNVGFRCGTCREFPVFDLKARKKLRLRERPLIMMDTTVLEKKYLGLDRDNIIKTMEKLARICYMFGDEFNVLWHNTNLVEKSQKRLFIEALEILVR